MENSNKFYQVSSVMLGSIAGVLIAVPVSSSIESAWGALLLLLFGLAGVLMGYRRRDSRMFFYLSIVCVLVLSSVIYRAFLTSGHY